MKIALLGYGVQARAAYEYWNKPENTITICDVNEHTKVPPGIETQLGPRYLDNLDRFDLLVRIPSLHPRDIATATQNHPEVLKRVTTVTNEFMRVCPTKNIIGVTGTKGKGTTSTLIAKMLEADGKKVHLGGNIGTPPLDLLNNNIQPEDIVVLELANFQLIDIKYSPSIAVCLMVVPEHMDWHTDMDEYIAAKQQLFRWQKPEDLAIYYADNENSAKVVNVSAAKKIPYTKAPGAFVQDDLVTIDGQTICKTSELKLLGKHNWQNVCAAVTAVWQVTKNVDAIKKVLTSFTGLEHRLELVRELDGVKYYDDSFGTTPETAIVAIEAFPQPKVVVLGGSDKGAPYDGLAKTVAKGNVRKALLIGDQAGRIQAALELEGFKDLVPGGNNMTEIIETARRIAKPGDIVLLSTGCASFGMFKNYKDRGEQFKQAVLALG